MATIEEIDYKSVANALIARFDREISVEQHEEIITNMTRTDRHIYFELSQVFSDKAIDLYMTTANSRKAKEDRDKIDEMFGD